jgi:hypothetical protein
MFQILSRAMLTKFKPFLIKITSAETELGNINPVATLSQSWNFSLAENLASLSL